MMIALYVALVLVIVALFAACGRGERPTGLSFFDAVHVIVVPAKHSKGKIQQKKTRK